MGGVMIIKRLFILQAVLLLGMGSVFLLPKFTGTQPMGVVLALPADLDGWHGEDGAVTDKEKSVLGPDTEFARKIYTNAMHNRIYVSIVLAGQDVNTSLHQPERCLPAQGFTIVNKNIETVPLNMKSMPSLQATRLQNVETNAPANGHASLYYYWFVGYNDVTASPFSRSLIDWRDRLFKGYNQRWAYVTVATGMRANSPESEAFADKTIKDFVADLFPKIWKPNASGG